MQQKKDVPLAFPETPEPYAAVTPDLNTRKSLYQWTYDVESLKGVPLAKEVPESDKPTLAWYKLLVPVVMDILENAFAVLETSAYPKEELQELKSDLKKFGADLQNLVSDIKNGNLIRGGFEFFKNASDLKELDEKLKEVIAYLKSEVEGNSSLAQYRALFQTIELPKVADLICSDQAFAELRVAGPNPMLIQQVKQLPNKLPLKDKDVAHLLAKGDSLKAALSDKRVFVCDYHELIQLEENTGEFLGHPKFLFAPIVAFVLNPKRTQLKPIAILVDQTQNNAPTVIPKKGKNTDYRWELAKSIANYADGNYHELFAHLSRTHLVEEAFTVATHRTLNENHPIYQLLVPHFEGTLSINNSAATSLIAEGGAIDHIFAGTIQASQNATIQDRLSFDFAKSMLHQDLKARGLDQVTVLPYYPYRDDATKVWQVIENWVTDYVNVYYGTDNEVKQDAELTSWTKEVSEQGKIKGLPAINGKNALVEVLTMVIFTASAQHAAVNFPQRSLMSYAPVITGAVWEK